MSDKPTRKPLRGRDRERVRSRDEIRGETIYSTVEEGTDLGKGISINEGEIKDLGKEEDVVEVQEPKKKSKWVKALLLTLIALVVVAAVFVLFWVLRGNKDVNNVDTGYIESVSTTLEDTTVETPSETTVEDTTVEEYVYDEQALTLDDIGTFNTLVVVKDSDTDEVLTVNIINKYGDSDDLRFIGVSPDSSVEVDEGGRQDKIKKIFVDGGIEGVTSSVARVFKTTIDRYIVIDDTVYGDLINQVGSVEVVPNFTESLGQYTYRNGESTSISGEDFGIYVSISKGGMYKRLVRNTALQRKILGAVTGADGFTIEQKGDFEDALNSGVLDTNLTMEDLLYFKDTILNNANSITTVVVKGVTVEVNGEYFYRIDLDHLVVIRNLFAGVLPQETTIAQDPVLESTQEQLQDTTNSEGVPTEPVEATAIPEQSEGFEQ